MTCYSISHCIIHLHRSKSFLQACLIQVNDAKFVNSTSTKQLNRAHYFDACLPASPSQHTTTAHHCRCIRQAIHIQRKIPEMSTLRINNKQWLPLLLLAFSPFAQATADYPCTTGLDCPAYAHAPTASEPTEVSANMNCVAGVLLSAREAERLLTDIEWENRSLAT